MAITSPAPLPRGAEQGCDPGQHPPEGRIQRLRIDHPEHRGIGVMRGYRRPELQEAPENMLLCPAEGCHLGAVRRPAEHRDKAHHKQFTQVVARIVGPGIVDVIEGGEKDVHAGEREPPEGRFLPKNPFRPRPQAPQISSDPKRDSPTSRP